MFKRFGHSNRRRGSVCAAGGAAAVMVGGGVDSIVVVDGRRVNRLDSAVLNNIPVRRVDKVRQFFSNAP